MELEGGITKERVRLRTNLEMRLAREACFKRDDYTCRSCGQHGGRLNAHHVWPFQRFPEWMYETWNLVTLCRHCHDEFHKAAGGHVKLAIGPFPGFIRQEEVKEAAAAYSTHAHKIQENVGIRYSSKVSATLNRFSVQPQFLG